MSLAHLCFLLTLLPFIVTATAFADSSETRTVLSDPSAWKPIASDGVKIVATPETAKSGKPSLRIDFDFTAGAGYGGVFLDLPIDLPENYELALSLHGEGPANNLELKLVDPEKLNVWWVNRRAFEWPAQSTRLINQRRHFQFAWGPSGGAPLTKLGRIELIIAAADGGKGTVWIDEMTFVPRPPVTPYTATPEITRTGDSLTVDFHSPREIGGARISWKQLRAPSQFSIETSDDGAKWTSIREVHGALGLPSYIALADVQTRWIRFSTAEIDQVEFLQPDLGSSPNALWHERATSSSPGLFPRNLTGKQSFWTIVGVPDDDREAIINEEGQIEVERKGFSIEPFIVLDGKLLTWSDGRHQQSLRDGWLPMPRVVRTHENVELTIDTFAAGQAAKSQLHAAYTIKNTSTQTQSGSLVLAVRPFQVLPPWQDLNITGGWTPIRSIQSDANGFIVNANKRVIASDGFRASASTYDMGDAVELLAAGKSVSENSVNCPQKSASGLLRWEFSLAPGASKSVLICVPFHDSTIPSDLPADISAFNALAESTSQQWEKAIDSGMFQLPPAARQFRDTILATQAYILINHNGKGFQPGSRTYFRSWIRDGSMTSAAMLELGHPDLVKRFIDYYAPYQFPSGKVPCVVDRRGSDPVAENDSHGQLIWLIANYYRYTHDKDLVQRHFERVKKTVQYIESLRAQRLTDEFSATGPTRQESDKSPVPALAFRGLVPESISHEGYSAKPMHSFWDQFYVLRGLKDAAYLAQVMDEKDLAQQWTKLADDFRTSVIESIRLIQQTHHIDYLPGCVELGDFDSTSSTILLWPVDEASHFPRAWIDATFNRAWTEFLKRRDTVPATWEGYTPYELRHVGAYVRLGHKDRAWAALNFFFSCQRPTGWRHWAEVVWRDRDTPRMIGDMPHTWCGSDFLNAVCAMFVYEDESSHRLILFAALPDEWFADPSGVGFRNLQTEYGTISASVTPDGANHLQVKLDCSALPPGGIEVRSPVNRIIKQATISGKAVPVQTGNSILIDSTTVMIDLYY